MKMNKQTLSIIMAAEAALIICVCIGVGGMFLYNRGLPEGGGASAAQPLDIAPTSTRADTAANVIATEAPTDEPASRLDSTAVENLPDGLTRYTDSSAGFELTIPAGWLAVRPDSDEFMVALSSVSSSNQMLNDQMTADQAGYEANHDRLFAYILHPEIQQNVIFGMSKLVWDGEDDTKLDNKALGELLRGLESTGVIPGFRANFSSIIENGNGVSLIVIKGRFPLDDGQGGSVPFSATIIVFKPTTTSVARMTFSFLQDYEEMISADVEAIIESVKVLGQ